MANVEITNDNTEEIKRRTAAAIRRGLEAVGIQAASNAKVEITMDPVRVDTGRLRNSITHAVQDESVYIGTNVEYAIYVHEGTSKMAPNRFLKNAAVRYKVDYKDIFEQMLKNG